MSHCTIRYRPSGGRGEYEFVPSNSLDGRAIDLYIEALDLYIDTQVYGKIDKTQSKPRLRKKKPNDRSSLHLPQLVMAIAALPEPSRTDLRTIVVKFPLENKSFVVESIKFEILHDDGARVVLAPLYAQILETEYQVNLVDRFRAINDDINKAQAGEILHDDLKSAILDHHKTFSLKVNSKSIRDSANLLIDAKERHFGKTNSGSVSSLLDVANKTEVDEEEYGAQEGKILTRTHVYKERDRDLVKKAKEHWRNRNNGVLECEVCGITPELEFTEGGARAIEAHHRTPIEQLQPDSITTVSDLAAVCANCHSVIHSRKPCLTVDEAKGRLNSE